ncbi:MAG: hypothetical protein Q7S72_00600, partial [Candidatus Taylorbacteria bacterium]|nr:hypothetical protein [Candidatus Taylorbacteria bacterium]
EINEIVNALFAQLVTQVLQKGLGAVSSKGSDGKSYLDKTITELNSEANPQLQSTKAELLKNTGMYKKNTLEYKKYRDEALAIMLSIKNGYDSAKACYVTKQTSQPRNRNSQNAQAAILEIDSILSTKVTAKTLNLFTAAKEADDRLKVLQDIENAANAAKTLNDLNAPSQKYSQMIQGRELITVIDIQKAKEELELIKTESYDLQQDALRKVQACQIY